MRIYFMSSWRIAKFAALGLVVGFLIAYGSGGVPIKHWLAPVTAVSMALFIVVVIFYAVIITRGAIYVRAGFPKIAFEKISYEIIKSVSLINQNGARTKESLWPIESHNKVSMPEDKMLFLEIELEGKRKKIRVLLRLFRPQKRAMIVQSILAKLANRGRSETPPIPRTPR